MDLCPGNNKNDLKECESDSLSLPLCTQQPMCSASLMFYRKLPFKNNTTQINMHVNMAIKINKSLWINAASSSTLFLLKTSQVKMHTEYVTTLSEMGLTHPALLALTNLPFWNGKSFPHFMVNIHKSFHLTSFLKRASGGLFCKLFLWQSKSRQRNCWQY